MKTYSFLLVFLVTVLWTCSNSQRAPLPYIGFHDVIDGDTVYHTIPNFSLLNQDSVVIGNKQLSAYIYVSDFFYTYCPSICPKVKNQMLRIYDRFEKEERLKLVSFALDPIRDDVERLNQYAKNIGVDSQRWHFLSGERETIWNLAEQYLISVRADEEEPGGIYHSGKILLIDREGRIRAFANGTEEAAVNAFMDDIDQLLQEL